MKKVEYPNKCTVCSTPFSLQDEGGISGNFGIIPVEFCPTCLSCMLDMADQLTEFDDDAE